MNGASSDACGGEWGDVSPSNKRSGGGEWEDSSCSPKGPTSEEQWWEKSSLIFKRWHGLSVIPKALDEL